MHALLVLLLICSCVVFATLKNASAPVVFLPGYSGSRLFAQIDDAENLPISCVGHVPIGTPFSVLLNASMILEARNCVCELTKLNFDVTSGVYSSQPGVKIFTESFGDFKAIEPVYWPFKNILESWGYRAGISLFGSPYDYRYMSTKSFQANGFFQQLKDLIEKAFLLNNHSKVVVVGHSNGGPTMYEFFHGGFVSQDWKDKYIAAMVGLSGNFLGQMNIYHSCTYNPMPAEQETICSWEAQWGSAPYDGYTPVRDVQVVTTNYGTAQEQSYTPKLEDMGALFERAGRHDWAVLLADTQTLRNRTAHPNVDSYCLYGSSVDTKFKYNYAGDILTSGAPVSVEVMNGDGNQDIIDNTFCNIWSTQSSSSSTANHLFESQEFPGVHHMQMYTDDDVMLALRQILLKYQAQ